MFCYKCGNKMEDDARFCNNCGEPVPVMENSAAPATNPSQLIKRPVLIGIIAALAVIIIGVYTFMAWVPPSFAKCMKAMQNLKSYEQVIRISVPYEDDVKLNVKADRAKSLTAISGTIEGERAEIFLDNDRLIIGSPDYDQYGAITLGDSKYNDKKTQTYIKALQKDLEPVMKVLTRQIIKENADIKFTHEKVNTPGGDIKVKQYTIKMDNDQITQAVIDTTNRLGNDHVFRDHINSAYSTTIDYILDVGEDSINDWQYEDLADSRAEFNQEIQNIAEQLDETEEQEDFKEEFEQSDISIELQLSFDYHNRLVKCVYDIESYDEAISIETTCYNFNKPVVINLPDSGDIQDLGDMDDLNEFMWELSY